MRGRAASGRQLRFAAAVLLGLSMLVPVPAAAAAAASGSTVRVSTATAPEADGSSGEQAVSRDGRYLAFSSDATNLVAGDDNGQSDVFWQDTWTGETRRVSVASNGSEGNRVSAAAALSGDGRYVAFGSLAANLVPGDTNGFSDVFWHDTADRGDPAGERGLRRHPSRPLELLTGDQRRWALRDLQIRGVEPGAR